MSTTAESLAALPNVRLGAKASRAASGSGRQHTSGNIEVRNCGFFCGCRSTDDDMAEPSKRMRWEYEDGPNGEKNGDVDWYCSRVFRCGWKHKYEGRVDDKGKKVDPRVSIKADLQSDKRVRDDFMRDVNMFRENCKQGCKRPMRGIGDRVPSSKRQKCVDEEDQTLRLHQPKNQFLPLKDYKKEHGNWKSKTNKEKGHFLTTINGVTGIEMPVKGPWIVERSTGRTIKMVAVVDEVADCGDSDECEVIHDQINKRFDHMKNETALLSMKKQNSARGKLVVDDPQSDSDHGEATPKIARNKSRKAAARSPTSPAAKQQDMPDSDPATLTPDSKKKAGRPSKDIFKLQEELRAEFEVADETSQFFDPNIAETKQKVVKRHVVTCSSRLVTAAVGDRDAIIRTRKGFQVVEAAIDLHLNWLNQEGSVIEAAKKFMDGWQQLAIFSRQHPIALVRCPYFEKLALGVICTHTPDHDMANVMNDQQMKECFPSQVVLPCRSTMGAQAIRAHMLRSRSLDVTIKILDKIACSLLSLSLDERFRNEVRMFRSVINPSHVPDMSKQNGSQLPDILAQVNSPESGLLNLFATCPLHGSEILKKARLAAAKQMENAELVCKVQALSSSSVDALSDARKGDTEEEGLDVLACLACLDKAYKYAGQRSALTEEQLTFCQTLAGQAVASWEEAIQGMFDVASSLTFDAWASWSTLQVVSQPEPVPLSPELLECIDRILKVPSLGTWLPDQPWARIMSCAKSICNNWATIVAAASGVLTDHATLETVNKMQPWSLLTEDQLVKVTALKKFFTNNVASTVSNFILQQGKEPMEKLHVAFKQIQKALADTEDASARLERFQKMELIVGDAGADLLKVMAGETNVAFYDGLARLAGGIAAVSATADTLDLHGAVAPNAYKVIYSNMSSLQQYMDCNSSIMQQSTFVAMADYNFEGFGVTLHRAQKFLAEIHTLLQQKANARATTIIKELYACTPTPDDMSKEQMLDEKELHAVLLDEKKRPSVPALVCKAKEEGDFARSLLATCGCQIIAEGTLEKLKVARTHGRLAVGLAFLVDHLNNKCPQKAELPAFAKEVQMKLAAKKIPLPSYAVARLKQLQGQDTR